MAMSDLEELLDHLYDRINELERGKESISKFVDMKDDYNYSRGWIAATNNELKFLDKVTTMFTLQVI
jgi:hypothetical protein